MDSELMIEIMNARIQQLREENRGENEPFELEKDEINTDLNMLSDHTFYLEEIDEKWRRFYKLKKVEQKMLAK